MQNRLRIPFSRLLWLKGVGWKKGTDTYAALRNAATPQLESNSCTPPRFSLTSEYNPNLPLIFSKSCKLRVSDQNTTSACRLPAMEIARALRMRTVQKAVYSGYATDELVGLLDLFVMMPWALFSALMAVGQFLCAQRPTSRFQTPCIGSQIPAPPPARVRFTVGVSGWREIWEEAGYILTNVFLDIEGHEADISAARLTDQCTKNPLLCPVGTGQRY